MGACAGKGACGVEPEAAVGAGDDRDPAEEIWDVVERIWHWQRLSID
jgi:hypothetical protein